MKKIIMLLLSVLLLSGCNETPTIVVEQPNIVVTDKENTTLHSYNKVTVADKDIVIETVVEITPKVEEPKVYYIVTDEEREMLARLVYLESSICSLECKEYVVSVIFNRLDSGRWTKDMNDDGKITLYDIVYYPEAFTPARNINNTVADSDCYTAVDNIITNGPTLPTEVRYFRTNHDFNWDNYEGYCNIDNLYFGYFKDWTEGNY